MLSVLRRLSVVLTRFMGAVLIVEATMSACTVLSSVRVVEYPETPGDS